MAEVDSPTAAFATPKRALASSLIAASTGVIRSCVVDSLGRLAKVATWAPAFILSWLVLWFLCDLLLLFDLLRVVEDNLILIRGSVVVVVDWCLLFRGSGCLLLNLFGLLLYNGDRLCLFGSSLALLLIFVFLILGEEVC